MHCEGRDVVGYDEWDQLVADRAGQAEPRPTKARLSITRIEKRQMNLDKVPRIVCAPLADANWICVGRGVSHLRA